MARNVLTYLLLVSLYKYIIIFWWIQLLGFIFWKPVIFYGDWILIFYIGFVLGCIIRMTQVDHKLVVNIEILADESLFIIYLSKFNINTAKESIRCLGVKKDGYYLHGTPLISSTILSSLESNCEYYILRSPIDRIKIKYILDRIEFHDKTNQTP